jgi:hypothetical protein
MERTMPAKFILRSYLFSYSVVLWEWPTGEGNKIFDQVQRALPAGTKHLPSQSQSLLCISDHMHDNWYYVFRASVHGETSFPSEVHQVPAILKGLGGVLPLRVTSLSIPGIHTNNSRSKDMVLPLYQVGSAQRRRHKHNGVLCELPVCNVAGLCHHKRCLWKVMNTDFAHMDKYLVGFYHHVNTLICVAFKHQCVELTSSCKSSCSMYNGQASCVDHLT